MTLLMLRDLVSELRRLGNVPRKYLRDIWMKERRVMLILINASCTIVLTALVGRVLYQLTDNKKSYAVYVALAICLFVPVISLTGSLPPHHVDPISHIGVWIPSFVSGLTLAIIAISYIVDVSVLRDELAEANALIKSQAMANANGDSTPIDADPQP